MAIQGLLEHLKSISQEKMVTRYKAKVIQSKYKGLRNVLKKQHARILLHVTDNGIARTIPAATANGRSRAKTRCCISAIIDATSDRASLRLELSLGILTFVFVLTIQLAYRPGHVRLARRVPLSQRGAGRPRQGGVGLSQGRNEKRNSRKYIKSDDVTCSTTFCAMTVWIDFLKPAC